MMMAHVRIFYSGMLSKLEMLQDIIPHRILHFLNDRDLTVFRTVSILVSRIIKKWVIVHFRQRLYACGQVKFIKVTDIGNGWQNVFFPDGSLVDNHGGIVESLRWNHEHNSLCEICGHGGEILLCDFCNLVYHTQCLQPPLFEVPEGDWACPSCKKDDKRSPVIGSAVIKPHNAGLYVTGGYHLRSFTPCTDVYSYSFENKTWILHQCQGNPPEYGFGNDQGFCVGQTISSFTWTGSSINSQVTFEYLHVLDLQIQTWCRYCTEGNIPESRIGQSLSVSEGNEKLIFMFGGLVLSKAYRNDLCVLNFSNKRWRELSGDAKHMCEFQPSQRSGQSLTNAAGRLWLIGGVGYKILPQKKIKRQKKNASEVKKIDFLNDVYAWDIFSEEWVQLPETKGQPLLPRSGHSTAAVGNNIFVYGGCNSQKYLGDWSVLNICTMTWSHPKSVVSPTPRMRASLVCESNSVILFGGGKRGFTSSPANNIEKYRGGMYEVFLATKLEKFERKNETVFYENDGDSAESKSHRAT